MHEDEIQRRIEKGIRLEVEKQETEQKERERKKAQQTADEERVRRRKMAPLMIVGGICGVCVGIWLIGNASHWAPGFILAAYSAKCIFENYGILS